MLKLQKNLKIILSVLLLSNPFVHCGDDWLKTANDARKAASILGGVQLKELKNAREKHSTRKEIAAALKKTSYKRVKADAADELAQILVTMLANEVNEKVAFAKKHNDSIPGKDTFVQGGGLLSYANISTESLIPFSFRLTKVTSDRFSNKKKWVDYLVNHQITDILKDENKVTPDTQQLITDMEKDVWKEEIGTTKFHLKNFNVSYFDYAHLVSPETVSILVGSNWNTLKNGNGEQILAQIILYLKHPVLKCLTHDTCEYFRNKVNGHRIFPNALLLEAENVTKNAKSAEFISDLIYYSIEVFGKMEYRKGLIQKGNHYSTYIELEGAPNETNEEIINKAVDQVFATRTSNFDPNTTRMSLAKKKKITMSALSEDDLCLLLTAKNLGLALTRRESKDILVIDYYD